MGYRNVIKELSRQVLLHCYKSKARPSSSPNVIHGRCFGVSVSTKMSATNNNVNEDFNEQLKPLAWLFGTWESHEGKGIYPTMADFDYGEEVQFVPVGMKPVIQYRCDSFKPHDKKSPIHNECGFIRPGPQPNQVSFIVSHMIGVSEIQEGKVDGESLVVETAETLHDPFYKLPRVKKIHRVLTRNGDTLEQVTGMETDRTEMTEHLRITFVKKE